MNRAERRAAARSGDVEKGAAVGSGSVTSRRRGRVGFAIGERFRIRGVVMEVEKIERKRVTLKSVGWADPPSPGLRRTSEAAPKLRDRDKCVQPGMGPGDDKAEDVKLTDEKTVEEVTADAAEVAAFAPEGAGEAAAPEPEVGENDGTEFGLDEPRSGDGETVVETATEDAEGTEGAGEASSGTAED